MDLHRTFTRRTLLCVGNDPDAREIVAQSLTEYELVFTDTALDALRNLNARAFDGYVSDYWLSDWAGPQLCRAIRDLDPHCPVVFFTAAAGDQNRARAMRAGASAYCCRTDADSERLDIAMRRLIARTDSNSLAAKARMEEAVMREIERCDAKRALDAGKTSVAESFVERSARKRAFTAFIEAGGCRSHFERWWPHVFASARATSNALAA